MRNPTPTTTKAAKALKTAIALVLCAVLGALPVACVQLSGHVPVACGEGCSDV